MGAVGVVLQLDAEMADLLRRLDEGAADVVIAGDADLEGNAGLGGVADGRRYAGIGHRHDDVGFDRRLSGQLAADPLTDLRSEEHTSELQSLMRNSYAGF